MKTKRIMIEVPYSMPLTILGKLAAMLGCSVYRVDDKRGPTYKFRPRNEAQT